VADAARHTRIADRQNNTSALALAAQGAEEHVTEHNTEKYAHRGSREHPSDNSAATDAATLRMLFPLTIFLVSSVFADVH